MPTIKFTERTIAKIKAPSPDGEQTLYWDVSLKGFGLLVSGKTSAKTFIVQRALDGRTCRVKIGAFNVLGLAEAKQRAQAVIGQFLRGVDPRRRRDEMTLRAALDQYLANRGANLRPRSRQNYREIVERHLKPWLDTPLREITRDMVEDRLKKIAATIARDGAYTGHATANGAMRAFRALFNYAADRADPSNPMPNSPVRLRTAWFEVPARTGRVADADLPVFYAGIMALRNVVARDYLLLVLFSGLRRREAAGLRWEDVDLQNAMIRLPASATKAGRAVTLPMSDFVRDLMVVRRADGDAKWVFPAASASGHLEEPKFFLREVAKISGVAVSVHDLRRTYASIAEGCDLSYYALKSLLNHSLKGDVTSGYIQMSPDRLRDPAQKVADRIKTLCAIEPPLGVARLR